MDLVRSPKERTRACPKCGHVSPASTRECPACQVIFDKVHGEVSQPRDRQPEPASDLGHDSSMQKLAQTDEAVIKQSVERWEAFTGWETANQYTVMDCLGSMIFMAMEESDSVAGFLGRTFLKAARPFTIHLLTPSGNPVLTLKRPFRFFFHELEVLGPHGEPLGTVRKQFSWLNRRYTVTDAGGEAYEVHGPLFRPWTFKIQRNGTECGIITKKWSGLVKEAWTDADNFGVSFPRGTSVRMKSVLLGAVFLIDFVHFEDNDR
jgi:uncharacterized protein YxjI